MQLLLCADLVRLFCLFKIELREFPDGDWERAHDQLLRDTTCTGLFPFFDTAKHNARSSGICSLLTVRDKEVLSAVERFTDALLCSANTHVLMLLLF